MRGLRRPSSHVDHLQHVPIGWVIGDVSDPASLEAAFSDCEVVFHCAALVSVRKQASPALRSTNVEGTRNVVAAAKRAGVRRLVHCSSMAAIGIGSAAAPATEQTAWNFAEYGLADGYAVTKREAEAMVLGDPTLDVVIANPTLLMGPYDAKVSSGKLIIETVQGHVPGYTLGSNNFADVRDVARGLVQLWQKGRRGERYILGGENLSYRDVMARIARLAGVPPLRFALPRTVARIMGAAGDLIERFGREPLLNSMTMRYVYTDIHFSSDKARREVGYVTSPIDQAIQSAIDWFRSHQMV